MSDNVVRDILRKELKVLGDDISNTKSLQPILAVSSVLARFVPVLFVGGVILSTIGALIAGKGAGITRFNSLMSFGNTAIWIAVLGTFAFYGIALLWGLLPRFTQYMSKRSNLSKIIYLCAIAVGASFLFGVLRIISAMAGFATKGN